VYGGKSSCIGINVREFRLFVVCVLVLVPLLIPQSISYAATEQDVLKVNGLLAVRNSYLVGSTEIICQDQNYIPDEKGKFSFDIPYEKLPTEITISNYSNNLNLQFTLPNLNGPTLDLKISLFNSSPGKILVTDVYSNPSTGYNWEVTESPDPEILEPREQYYLSQSTDRSRAGSGGKLYLFYEAKNEGKTMFSYRYKRSWLDDETARAFFVGIVDVTE